MAIEQLDDIAQHFVGWQCRLRQHSVRRSDGRPSAGMHAQITLEDGSELGHIICVLVKQEPEEATTQFRYIVKQTQDPLERLEKAVKTLQTVYYQHPREFAAAPTALFNADSTIAAKLVQKRSCNLRFKQANQSYAFTAAVLDLEQSHPHYQQTYWHNAMFNPHLQGDVRILQFEPKWAQAVAETGI